MASIDTNYGVPPTLNTLRSSCLLTERGQRHALLSLRIRLFCKKILSMRLHIRGGSCRLVNFAFENEDCTARLLFPHQTGIPQNSGSTALLSHLPARNCKGPSRCTREGVLRTGYT